MPTPHLHWEKASFFYRSPQGQKCTLCPHSCTLNNGESGKCSIRRVKNNQAETAAFTLAVKHFGTIERKPLYHFKPGSQVLTLATPSCSFRCLYCQNYRLSQWDHIGSSAFETNRINVKEIISEATSIKTNNNAIIGISYSEPSISAELTLELAKMSCDQDVDIVWKSNGFLTPFAVEQISPHISAINIDLKTINNKAHKSLTGASIYPILNTIESFLAAGVWVEISTPIIPRFNTKPEILQGIAQFIQSLSPSTPWHLTRFIPEYKMKNLPPASMLELQQAYDIGKEAGLKYVYRERSDHPQSQTTFCPTCQKPLIHRNIWQLQKNSLHNGCCSHCHTTIDGCWA